MSRSLTGGAGTVRGSLLVVTTAIAAIVLSALRPVAQSSPAQTAACNAPAKETTSTIKLSGSPFSAIPTADGCTIFVSLNGPGGHIGVFRRAGGEVTLTHDIPIASAPAGMALSHDGKLLAAAAGARVLLFEVDKLMAGDNTPLASASDGPNAGSVYAAITADDRLLFISDEGTATLSVYDLAKLRSRATEPVGPIPVGRLPVGLVQSPDGRMLYSTSEIATASSGSPATCRAEGGGGGNTPQGVLSVIDVAGAARDPANAVVASVAAGCDPVRIALSARGDRAYVTARGENSLLVFDTEKLRSDPAHARIATVPVGQSPVGVLAAGNRIITADSNRFASGTQEWLSVVDAGKVGEGAAAVIGHVPTGAFPRELRLTADGKTMLVTNFISGTLELIDLARLTPAYFSDQQQAKKGDDARRR